MTASASRRRKAVAEAQAGSKVVLLENLRFHAEEEKNDPAFAKQLAELARPLRERRLRLGASRARVRPRASSSSLPKAAAGLLMEKELQVPRARRIENPERPFVAILGGAKVSDKIEVIENFSSKVDTLLIGGAMAYTFFKAQG